MKQQIIEWLRHQPENTDSNPDLIERFISQTGESIPLLLQERIHHFELGYTLEHDKKYENGELKQAATAILWYGQAGGSLRQFPESWSSQLIFKLFDKQYPERLIIAASFLMAEYEATKSNIWNQDLTLSV